MRPHLLRVQMYRVFKEQRGQAEGMTVFERSSIRLPDIMHTRALCAIVDSFASMQHRQPSVGTQGGDNSEHWRYAALDLTCLTLLRSARCHCCSPPPPPISPPLRYKGGRVSEIYSEVGMQVCWHNFAVLAGVLPVSVDQAVFVVPSVVSTISPVLKLSWCARPVFKPSSEYVEVSV